MSPASPDPYLRKLDELCAEVKSLRRSIDGDDDHLGLRARIAQIEATLERLERQSEQRRSGIWDIATTLLGAVMGAVTGYFASKAGG